MMRFLLPLLAAFLLGACAEPQPPLAVADVVITGSMPGMKMSAGYLTFTNNSGEPITITHVSSPQFASVEMHETVVEDDVARMRELPELVIPARGSVAFERGGKHLMLMRPTGDSSEVTLNIYSGDTLLLIVNADRPAR